MWSKRYDLINDFETMLSRNGTTILKFFLHISQEEQLSRFKQRLDDPSRCLVVDLSAKCDAACLLFWSLFGGKADMG